MFSTTYGPQRLDDCLSFLSSQRPSLEPSYLLHLMWPAPQVEKNKHRCCSRKHVHSNSLTDTGREPWLYRRKIYGKIPTEGERKVS